MPTSPVPSKPSVPGSGTVEVPPQVARLPLSLPVPPPVGPSIQIEQLALENPPRWKMRSVGLPVIVNVPSGNVSPLPPAFFTPLTGLNGPSPAAVLVNNPVLSVIVPESTATTKSFPEFVTPFRLKSVIVSTPPLNV